MWLITPIGFFSVVRKPADLDRGDGPPGRSHRRLELQGRGGARLRGASAACRPPQAWATQVVHLVPRAVLGGVLTAAAAAPLCALSTAS